MTPDPEVPRKRGRPEGSTKPKIEVSTKTTLESLKQRISGMIETQVDQVDKDLKKMAREDANAIIPDHSKCAGRIEIAQNLAALMKTISLVEKSTSHESDGPSEEMTGEEIVRMLEKEK